MGEEIMPARLCFCICLLGLAYSSPRWLQAKEKSIADEQELNRAEDENQVLTLGNSEYHDVDEHNNLELSEDLSEQNIAFGPSGRRRWPRQAADVGQECSSKEENSETFKEAELNLLSKKGKDKGENNLADRSNILHDEDIILEKQIMLVTQKERL